MTLYHGDQEDCTKTADGTPLSLPKSAPRGTGYLIRKRLKQKGDYPTLYPILITRFGGFFLCR
ncbi:hypothetical protein Hena1_00030 [Erwinia phage Hena1]|uniref:Uncharacterized protein n=1 Tax=Erwinia phage Hena1 TaxID=2678601 RepID=A0A6B9J9M0_9CAUD|nr:hypothetical protein HWC84_gp002 [Erwinia phage Hena1]QGZ16179.1 hypothetical protein Hena1_00030 [Erwinia phage Hena1]